MSQDLVGHGDIEITKAQNRNYALADGFQRMTSNKRSNTWPLFLRYKVLTEREYRRAKEEFEGLKALRHDLPNGPISDAQPEPNETTCDSSPTDPIPPQNPVLTSPEPPPGPPPAPPGPPAPVPGIGSLTSNHRSNDHSRETSPIGAMMRAVDVQIAPRRRSLCGPARKTRRCLKVEVLVPPHLHIFYRDIRQPHQYPVRGNGIAKGERTL
jgi:hypothetical protein